MENENVQKLGMLQNQEMDAKQEEPAQMTNAQAPVQAPAQMQMPEAASLDTPAGEAFAGGSFADVPSAAAQGVQAGEANLATLPRKQTRGERIAGYFTATRIAYIAIFTAISYVLGLLDFMVIPAVPFLKVDFSNTFVMIAGFSLGPVAGVIVAVLKELLHAITFGQTAFVGELANVLLVLPYMLIPAIVYRKHKGIKVVIVTLILGCIAQCIVCIPVNYLLNFPAYMKAFMGTTWKEGMDYFLELWYFALAFNAIKTVLVSVATLIVYKPLSKLIKMTAAKFDKMKAKRNTKV